MSGMGTWIVHSGCEGRRRLCSSILIAPLLCSEFICMLTSGAHHHSPCTSFQGMPPTPPRLCALNSQAPAAAELARAPSLLGKEKGGLLRYCAANLIPLYCLNPPSREGHCLAFVY